MRFAIMQETVGYRPGDADAEEAITGQEGELLRLLLLRRGHPLSKEEIARHLTRTGKNRVLPSSVRPLVAVEPLAVLVRTGEQWPAPGRVD